MKWVYFFHSIHSNEKKKKYEMRVAKNVIFHIYMNVLNAIIFTGKLFPTHIHKSNIIALVYSLEAEL